MEKYMDKTATNTKCGDGSRMFATMICKTLLSIDELVNVADDTT